MAILQGEAEEDERGIALVEAKAIDPTLLQV
jgi:hypothetical protein